MAEGEGGEFLRHENICFAGQQDLSADLEPPPAPVLQPSPQLEPPRSLPKAGSPAHLHNGELLPGPPSPFHLCTHPRGLAPTHMTLPRRAAEPNSPSSSDLSSEHRNDFLKKLLNTASMTQKLPRKDLRLALCFDLPPSFCYLSPAPTLPNLTA